MKLSSISAMIFLWSMIERGDCAEFEKLGKAVAKVLGTKKAMQSQTSKGEPLFYSKGKGGKAEKFAFIEKGIYEPNCTHTWVVGVDAKSLKVTEVRVIEMSCPHAFPARANSFLDQFKGKAPADVSSLKKSIATIAKATGTCDLTTQAVGRVLLEAQSVRGKI
jgi:hypothetical protein